MYKDRKLDEEGYQLMLRHYEERRKEKLRVCLEVSYFMTTHIFNRSIKEREDLIEDEKNGIINFDSVVSISSSSHSSSPLLGAKERHFIRFRQFWRIEDQHNLKRRLTVW